MRGFLGIDLSREGVPNATTLLGFRHLPEAHDLTARILETINARLRERGLLLAKGTLVDATVITAPSSTKNRAKTRDPDMHQAKKGKPWHFGMKAHIGADAHSGPGHSLQCTLATVADVTVTAQRLHGEETVVVADAGDIGAQTRAELQDREVSRHIAMKRGTLEGMGAGPPKDLTERAETLKAKVRARVEHPFHVIKNLFPHRKVRYKGLAKNRAQLEVLFGLANLVPAKRALLA